MDDLTPSATDLFAVPDAAHVKRAFPAVNRHPHVLLTGSHAACARVRAAIGGDYHVIPVLDGQRALHLLRAMRHLLLIVAGDDLLSLDAPGLFALLAKEPDMAARHSYVYLTSGTRRFDVAFAWHLELLRVTVVHIPAPQHDLLEQVACAARHARLHALDVAMPGRTRERNDSVGNVSNGDVAVSGE